MTNRKSTKTIVTIAVSYTHLDVYKRQATGRLRTSNKLPFAPPHRPLQDSMVKNQNDQRTMSLRSINLKIGRLSGNECAIFEPRTATGRLRTSSKVPFAPSHRRLPVSYTHLLTFLKRSIEV